MLFSLSALPHAHTCIHTRHFPEQLNGDFEYQNNGKDCPSAPSPTTLRKGEGRVRGWAWDGLGVRHRPCTGRWGRCRAPVGSRVKHMGRVLPRQSI